MMIHVWRNHSFFWFQCNDFIQNFSAFFSSYSTSKNQPYLAGIIDLFFITAHKQTCLFIQKIFFCCCGLFLCFFCKLFCFCCFSEDFRNLLYFFCTVDVNALHSSLFIEAFSPVNESPEAISVFHQMFFIKLFACDLHLTIRTFTQIFQSLFVSGCLIIIQKCCTKEHGIVQKEGIIYNKFRLCKQAGAYLTVVFCLSRKQIQTSFYQIHIMESFIICKCLES